MYIVYSIAQLKKLQWIVASNLQQFQATNTPRKQFVQPNVTEVWIDIHAQYKKYVYNSINVLLIASLVSILKDASNTGFMDVHLVINSNY